MLRELEVAGYRSLRNVTLKLGRVNVIVGPNGSGKSNLYRSVMLLQAAAEGRFARALAEEGGMPSVLWAGDRPAKQPVRVKFRARTEDAEFDFECGLPTPSKSLFGLDPFVKEERIRFRTGGKWVLLLERLNSSMWARDVTGSKRQFSTDDLVHWESALSQLSEPEQFPAVALVAREMRAWRFHHQFRTDPDSPIRRPQVGTRTTVLGGDGRDLAAAMQTIFEIGDGEAFLAAAEAGLGASPGVRSVEGRFEPTLHVGLPRRMNATEMSDGTLRYLCLLAALYSPRPAPMLAFNEPESSLHLDLIAPLADQFVRASQHSGLWITTHSLELAERVCAATKTRPICLEKADRETRIVRDDGPDD